MFYPKIVNNYPHLSTPSLLFSFSLIKAWQLQEKPGSRSRQIETHHQYRSHMSNAGSFPHMINKLTKELSDASRIAVEIRFPSANGGSRKTGEIEIVKVNGCSTVNSFSHYVADITTRLLEETRDYLGVIPGVERPYYLNHLIRRIRCIGKVAGPGKANIEKVWKYSTAWSMQLWDVKQILEDQKKWIEWIPVTGVPAEAIVVPPSKITVAMTRDAMAAFYRIQKESGLFGNTPPGEICKMIVTNFKTKGNTDLKLKRLRNVFDVPTEFAIQCCLDQLRDQLEQGEKLMQRYCNS